MHYYVRYRISLQGTECIVDEVMTQYIYVVIKATTARDHKQKNPTTAKSRTNTMNAFATHILFSKF